MSYAGKTAEQSSGRTIGRASMGRGDGERDVTTAHAHWCRTRGRQLNVSQAVSTQWRRETANADGQHCAVITGVASCCLVFHPP